MSSGALALPALKLRGLGNALARGSRWGALVAVGFLALVAWAEVAGVLRALEFLDGYGTIGRAVGARGLETGLVVLAAGVTFSAVTTAISTLYTSDDLNFLLAQPIPAGRVFALKLGETYLNAAGIPTLLVLPIVAALGAHLAAPAWYYPLAALAAVLAFALPVGLGAALAVLLMRVAPLGRVREVATGLGVALSASLILLVRALRPEILLRQLDNPEQFERLLEGFASPTSPLLPPAWAARAIWDGARGEVSAGLWPLAALSALVLLGAGRLAAHAYQAGWVRGLESSRAHLDPRPRGASWLERAFARFGPGGQLAFKDARLLWRDATQWSQLLILVALAGVYLVSVSAFPVTGEAFRNAAGFVQLALVGLVVGGVGVRMSFPSVSLEGPGYWLLRTSPLSARQVVLAKYWGALPPVLLLALALGLASARILDLSESITLASVLLAASNALALTALGVGLGAAMPRFRADNPAEIAVTPGALVYVVLSLAYSLLLVLVVARPAYLSIVRPGLFPGLAYWTSPEGALVLGLLAVVTAFGTWWPLWFGWSRLDRLE